jgi:hypothetical protein
MLHQVRRQLRFLAAIVLVSVSALGAWTSTVHELDCHDAECAPLTVVHDASAHAFRSAEQPPGEREIHCVLCHWTRVLGPGVQSVAAAPYIVSQSRAVPVADASVVRLVTAAQPPLRAPPSASTFDLVA